MATGIRVLVVLGALMGSAGCLVGPQDDFPVDPGAQDRDNDDNPAAGADGDADGAGTGVDGDADADAEEPPVDEFAGYPDDGDFAEGDSDSDPDSEGGELGDKLIPRLVPPELPPIPPPSSDFGLERSDDPAPPATDATDDPGN